MSDDVELIVVDSLTVVSRPVKPEPKPEPAPLPKPKKA